MVLVPGQNSFWLGDNVEVKLTAHQPSQEKELPCRQSWSTLLKPLSLCSGRGKVAKGYTLKWPRAPMPCIDEEGRLPDEENNAERRQRMWQRKQEYRSVLRPMVAVKLSLQSLGSLPVYLLLRELSSSATKEQLALQMLAVHAPGLALQVASPEGVKRVVARYPSTLLSVSSMSNAALSVMVVSHHLDPLLGLMVLQTTKAVETLAWDAWLGESQDENNVCLQSEGLGGVVAGPFVSACVGAWVLHLTRGSPGRALLFSSLTSLVITVAHQGFTSDGVVKDVIRETQSTRDTFYEEQSFMDRDRQRLVSPLALQSVGQTFWAACLPLGFWGPWESMHFRQVLGVLAVPLVPFELCVALSPAKYTSNVQGMRDTHQSSRPRQASLELLRALGVAHVVVFHQLHEGRAAELCSRWAPGLVSGHLCGLGEAGMYWVGFYFLLSGFVGAYNSQDSRDEGACAFTYNRMRGLVPVYAMSLVLGVSAATLSQDHVADHFATAIFKNDQTQIGRALVFSNVLLWPFSFGSLSGPLSHLWYINALWPLLCRFPAWDAFLRELHPRQLSAALLWCWLATVAVPWGNLNHLLAPNHGDLMNHPPIWMVYFIYYHPLTNWMYFAGGVALARLMAHTNRWSPSVGQASDLLERWGASASLLALGVGLPFLDSSHRGSIILRQIHGPLVAPFLGAMLYAGARGKDPLLGLLPLCDAVKGSSGPWIEEWLGNVSRPAFFLHKPLHELQWNLVEMAQPHSVPRILTGTAGMVLHWIVVFGASATVQEATKKKQQKMENLQEPNKESKIAPRS